MFVQVSTIDMYRKTFFEIVTSSESTVLLKGGKFRIDLKLLGLEQIFFEIETF